MKNVPVLTKGGYNFNSRCGESIIKNAGIGNFIATNDEDYFEKAVYYSSNINELNKVRKIFLNKFKSHLYLIQNYLLMIFVKVLKK